MVTAFQPSCQIPRVPSIEKNCVVRVDGASAAAKLDAMLTPWIGIWVTPRTVVAARLKPEALQHGRHEVDGVVVLVRGSRRGPAMPAGQETMHGSQVPPLNE